MSPPSRSPSPDLGAIRQRLTSMLDKLQNSENMPLSERELRMWQLILPNMAKWLPEAEANAIRGIFEDELERLRTVP